MTKQEEIQGAFTDAILKRHPDMTRNDAGWEAVAYKRLLAKFGVAIKVDRELPECPISLEDGLSPSVTKFREYSIKQYCLAQLILLEAGYVAVEPLISK